MAKKSLFVGMLVLAFCFIGCDDGSTDVDGGAPEEVKSLPAFEGTFVADETEASTLASGCQAQIQTAISAALSNGGVSGNILPSLNVEGALNNVSRSVGSPGTSGHYSYNGVSLDYTVSTSGSYPSYPWSATIDEVVTINGTYGGYKISGQCTIHLVESFTSASSYTMAYTYDETFVVSYGGKGMKLVYTGSMNTGTSGSTTYNVHYAVYDNSNTRRYNYDYVYP